MQETQIIQGYPVKNYCVMCKTPMEFSWSNYQTRGNFCSPCNASCTGRGIKVREIRKKVLNAFDLDE